MKSVVVARKDGPPLTLRIHGEWADTDYLYGPQYETIQACIADLEAIRLEVWFDSFEVTLGGEVFLILTSDRPTTRVRVGSAKMSSRHADAHLIIGDA